MWTTAALLVAAVAATGSAQQHDTTMPAMPPSAITAHTTRTITVAQIGGRADRSSAKLATPFANATAATKTP